MQRLEAFIQKLEEGRREPASWECEHALRALRALEESDFNARRAGDHVGRVACYARGAGNKSVLVEKKKNRSIDISQSAEKPKIQPRRGIVVSMPPSFEISRV